MTGNPNLLTQDQQLDWYYKEYTPAHDNGLCHAFVGYEDGKPIAYGLVTQREEDFWVTGVITTEARGYGYGEQLFRYLTSFVFDNDIARRVMLDVLVGNERALQLYRKIGFASMCRVDNKLTMYLDKEKYNES
jgi:ribosomal protein S18 acetylase RimI-like enzyme